MIKVLIVDDKKPLRNGIKTIIEQDDEIEVVGESSNGYEALEMSKKLIPDLVLMDIEMPVCNGIEGTRLIKEFNRAIKIIVLTVFEDNEKISMALKNGADGYLLKDIQDDELINAIKFTFRGFSIVQQSVFKSISDNYGSTNQTDENKNSDVSNENAIALTARETDIIKLIVNGYSNKQIAFELNIAEGTVRNIISNLLAKTNLFDRTQLAVYALKHNIV